MDKDLREINPSELRVLKLLLKQAERFIEIPHSDTILVLELDDGGMGSIRFIHSTEDQTQIQFGGNVSSLSFKDSDGVEVSVALYVDQFDRPYELDFWKKDFSRLVKIPKEIF